MTVARARCHQPLRRGRGGSVADEADASAPAVANGVFGRLRTGGAGHLLLSLCSAAAATGDSTTVVLHEERITGPHGCRIVRFRPGELLLKRHRGGRIETWRQRLDLGLSISLSEPISPASRTSRSTVTLCSAPRTSSIESVNITGRRNEIASDFGHDRQAVVRRLWGVRREIVSERPVSTAAAATAAAADLTFLRQGASPVVTQMADLFIFLVAAGFNGLIFFRFD